MFRAAKILLSTLSTVAVHHQRPPLQVPRTTFVQIRTSATIPSDRYIQEMMLKNLLILGREVSARFNDYYDAMGTPELKINTTLYGANMSIDEEVKRMFEINPNLDNTTIFRIFHSTMRLAQRICHQDPEYNQDLLDIIESIKSPGDLELYLPCLSTRFWE